MELATNFRRSDSPPWPRRGGRDIKQDAAKPPLRSGWGGSFNYELIGDLNEPPRLRLSWRLRGICLMAQPPLLDQGGEGESRVTATNLLTNISYLGRLCLGQGGEHMPAYWR